MTIHARSESDLNAFAFDLRLEESVLFPKRLSSILRSVHKQLILAWPGLYRMLVIDRVWLDIVISHTLPLHRSIIPSSSMKPAFSNSNFHHRLTFAFMSPESGRDDKEYANIVSEDNN